MSTIALIMTQFHPMFDLKSIISYIYTYILWSSAFALYLKRLLGIITLYDPRFDLNLTVGHGDMNFMV